MRRKPGVSVAFFPSFYLVCFCFCNGWLWHCFSLDLALRSGTIVNLSPARQDLPRICGIWVGSMFGVLDKG
jgi:hypothetical protein